MQKEWKNLDLEGGGLQTVNLNMTRLQKHRGVAYALWLLFPLGAHRVYLNTSATSLIYTALTGLAAILWLSVGKAALVPLAAEALLAVFDLFWIDRRVLAINKALRMELYMGTGARPPSGYRGRYGDDPTTLLEEYKAVKEREKAGVQPVGKDREAARGRIPSFAEQEAMLREITRRRDKKEPPRD